MTRLRQEYCSTNGGGDDAKFHDANPNDVNDDNHKNTIVQLNCTFYTKPFD